MLTFTQITEIDDLTFKTLFDHSLPDMDSGTYDWNILARAVTYEDKIAHFRSKYNEAFVNGFAWIVKDDDWPLQLNAGKLEGDRVKWHLGLLSPDEQGSKAYLYSQAYIDARNAFWDSLGITGWDIDVLGSEGKVANHFRSRKSADMLDSELVIEPRDIPVLPIADIKLTR